jgi:hypothetical protein
MMKVLGILVVTWYDERMKTISIPTGSEFDRWTTIGELYYAHHYKQRSLFVLCRCVCGTERPVLAYTLRNGTSRSCGCIISEGVSRWTLESKTKHGHAGEGRKSREWRCWWSMINRCSNPNEPGWKRYGGRGITVCRQWKTSFQAFFDHIGPCPSAQHTIDRIENNKGYYPGNVKWGTKKEQARNRRSSRLVTLNGETRTLAEWIEVLNLKRTTVSDRIYKRNWTPERALTEPINRDFIPLKHR